MNSIFEHIKAYIIACFTMAMLYAFLVGNQPVVFRIADGVIYGVLLFLVGYLLWNVFRYAIPPKGQVVYQLIILFILFILTSVLVVGIETFVFYLYYPDSLPAFVPSIPVRLFITLLLFVIYRLFYMSYLTKEDVTNKTEVSPVVQTEIVDRLTVRYGQKIKIIPVNEIIYFKADGDYVDIYTAEGHWLKEQTMKYTEDTLPPERFVRTHRSYIVNIHHISRIERYGEQQLIILSNGEKIKISNARYQILKQRLGL